MANPTISELQNPEKFELVAKLHHDQIKEFVFGRIADGGKMIISFMIYQALMIAAGSYFLTKAVILAFRSSPGPLFITLAALVFSFTLMIPIHEMLHGIALKFTGAKHIHFGGYLKKFIFYAEADKHVLNRRQFAFIALTPLVAVQLTTLVFALLFLNQPQFYFVIFVMSAHSLFCAGDIGLLSVFYRETNAEIFTFDVKSEKTSYYFKKITD